MEAVASQLEGRNVVSEVTGFRPFGNQRRKIGEMLLRPGDVLSLMQESRDLAVAALAGYAANACSTASSRSPAVPA